MKVLHLLAALSACLACPLSAQQPFGEQRSASGIRHSFLVAGNRTILVGEKNEVVWEYFNPAIKAHEVHVLTTNGKPEAALK